MFDTHTHLNFPDLSQNVDNYIKAAQEAGVLYMLVPGTNIALSSQAVEIADRYKGVYAAVGIHPTELEDTVSLGSAMQALERLAQSSSKVVAIGEIGLDKKGRPDREAFERQVACFTAQWQLARKLQKRVIIHSRYTGKELLEVLDQMWDPWYEGKVVFHCCEPDERLLAFALAHGVYIGVDGDITYSPEKQEFIKKVPLSSLVLETDAPFLLPEPLRSQKKYPNSPANLVYIARCVGSLREENEETVRKVTSENGRRLFGVMA